MSGFTAQEIYLLPTGQLVLTERNVLQQVKFTKVGHIYGD
jgi:hypothetical protein